jgi:hypothetical protein
VMRNRNLSGDVRLPLRLDIRRYDVRFEQTFALQLAMSAKSENGRQLVRATSSRARKSAASEPHLIASVPSITT